MATAAGTWEYRDRFGDAYGRTYFRRFGPGVVSSIGAGTYLGEPTDAVDERYREALVAALEHGCNFLDTAVNYRCGRAERVVGRALREADVPREAVVVATKGGFVPFDGSRPEDLGEYVRETVLEAGLAEPADLARGSHCLAPGFIEAMVDRSLDRLDVDRLDCYYLHNPETQLAARSRGAVYDQLEAAFERLERRVLAGEVGRYGVATWEAFRAPAEGEAYLSLSEVLARARAAAASVGADEHHLEAVQLPFNVHMADAHTRTNHEYDGEPVSALEFAHEAGLRVVASASLLQGELVSALPEHVADRVAGDTPAQRAINFARSAPAVTAALVGTSRPEHVAENLAAGTFDPLGAAAFEETFA